MSEDEKWIQSAIKHHGSLKAYAKEHNRMMKDGTIDKAWLEDLSSGNDVWAKRARLALTLNSMHKEHSEMMDKRNSTFPVESKAPSNEEV